MAIELKLAKPHKAKVTMARVRSLITSGAIAPRSMKATNSFRTSLVPNRPPAVPASCQGTPIRPAKKTSDLSRAGLSPLGV